jgi:hypothetical protein
LQDDVKELQQKNYNLDAKLLEKTKKITADMGNERGRIEKEFKRYSLYEDLRDLRDECIPEIDKFYQELQA